MPAYVFNQYAGPTRLMPVCQLCPPMHVFKCGCWLCLPQVGLPALHASIRLQPVCWPHPSHACLMPICQLCHLCTSLSAGAGFARPKSVLSVSVCRVASPHMYVGIHVLSEFCSDHHNDNRSKICSHPSDSTLPSLQTSTIWTSTLWISTLTGIQTVLANYKNANRKMNSKSAYQQLQCQREEEFKEHLPAMAMATGRGIQTVLTEDGNTNEYSN
jgi:hypothetical protein